jgi:amidase
MNSAHLAFAGAARQAELVRDGEVSSRELVELYLERIERLQPELNCFSRVMAERALADAQQADGRRGVGGGAADRPLLGVPIAVKDVMEVAGEVTTWGTDAHDNTPERQDCELVRLLRAAGAVIVGKTTAPELAIMGDTEGPAFGVTRNPWDPERSPGGSSGGSGAAVAAGLCAAATASDGAGSIRIPAAANGLFGLKPQRDRISLAPHTEHWHGLSVYGFETRTVRDTALLLDTTAARAPERSYSEAAAAEPGKLRIAVTTRSPWPYPVTRPVRRVLDSTAELLRSLGHTVEERHPPFGTVSNAITALYLRGIADDVRGTARPSRLQRRTRSLGRIGGLVGDGTLRWARREGERFAARCEEFFAGFDALLTPVSTRPPVAAANWEGRGAIPTLVGLTMTFPFNIAWNATGQPAAAIPAGTSDDGMPIGMQLVGRRDGEPTLLSLASQLERELGWPERRPPVA